MKKTLIALALTSFSLSAQAADSSKQGIEQRLDALSQQVEALQAEIKQLKAQNEALAAQQEQQAAPAANSSTASAAATGAATLWGYGEVVYSRPIHDPDSTTMDLARAVVGVGYRFNERTRFNSEFEIEHAVASADDEGEVEVEQFYIDHKLGAQLGAKAGLFLMPAGYINQSHEPNRYYGVRRNFIETLIIPSTWREGGAALYGSTASGLSWEGGVTTGVNFADWNFIEVPELEDQAVLAATHQELMNADASHLQEYLALNYNGIPGYNLGASVYTGNATAPTSTSDLSPLRVTLWEAHTRWTPGDLDLSALYARGTVSNTAEANGLYPGAVNPIPSSFFGYYAQAAYAVWKNQEQRLVPFARWERYNLAHDYKGLISGATVGPKPTETVWTFGASYYLNPQVVIKADYQMFDLDDSLDRWNLGLGLAF
ncbi:Phosphate-selective porin [Solimonas aquatica]|uniref:Phosphate-selective porin n=1 Tax=Solimonas aquatica TaxID=489703 RepID=A0A1H9KDV9_9GAMM|nr:carbohydrate porin [Solimonas aquatica]SEQ97366.1 Phosphate-selective porin [Solimonas aquatica]